jgi:polar amino acid transport system permease protein
MQVTQAGGNGVLLEIVRSLLIGAEVTLEVTLLAALLGCGVAFVVGISRLARHPVIRIAAGLYVEIMRGVSALVVLFWFYFALPFFGIQLTALEAGVLGLGLTYGAYGAEVVRGAILQVPQGQWEAAMALNMTRAQQMRLVILPQAVIAMLPPLGNLLVDLLKATSLVSLITLSDLTFHARILQNSIGHTTQVFAVTLCMYFVMCYVLTLLVRRLERRLSRGQEVGRVATATMAVS